MAPRRRRADADDEAQAQADLREVRRRDRGAVLLSGLADALRPRYGDTPAGAGLYESLYFTAHHPTEPRALWVRHTILRAPDGPPRGALWCTWFDHDGVRAAKLTTRAVSGGATSGEPAAAAEASPPGAALDIGGYGWIGADGAVGAVDHDGFRASWNLTFRDPEPPMFHLPQPWMYTAPVPRTKSTSAAPRLTLGGSLTVDGAAVDVDGWPCTIGHNWGSEHAERWIWLHADADTGPDGPTVWLDAVLGRIRLGPVTTPWIGNGAVSVAGQRYRLGGLNPRGTRVVETAQGATVILRGSGVRVEARADIVPTRCVGWTYADPAGHTREVVNSSVARTMLSIRRGDRPSLDVTAPVSAFELGAPRRAFDVPLQPFPD